MDYLEYSTKVKSRYNGSKSIEGKENLIDVLYDEKFEWKWFATKLKMFSFISYSSIVEENTIKAYSKTTFEYARKNYKGLPRGIQNGFTSFALLASEDISKEAIDFVQRRPTKHFSAFEMPILYDLNREVLYFYRNTPIWGQIYYEYFREYILKNFSCISS
ncbi:hypothetical protein EDC18_101530 [Natranaerovirga pectinivora]|uniref:Uncharacterized protein n=1 Tax=Natranaerovirga pectinivora TaxID=682400 RepID=A0A4R3MQP8_9FIRM|nr:hypothetical protein [Natranaerovirga pectinivora]TCT17232.1 hypothetical protein EDC18_101530 [Natranaerovirga pectinivora]